MDAPRSHAVEPFKTRSSECEAERLTHGCGVLPLHEHPGLVLSHMIDEVSFSIVESQVRQLKVSSGGVTCLLSLDAWSTRFTAGALPVVGLQTRLSGS